MATLLELPFCKKDPGKNLGFAMSPVGRPAGVAGPNSGDRRRWGAGRRRGKVQGSPRARFGGLEGALEGPAGELGGARRWPPRRR
jgi:hypothetical protein